MSTKERREAIEFLRTHICLYEGRNVRDIASRIRKLRGEDE